MALKTWNVDKYELAFRHRAKAYLQPDDGLAVIFLWEGAVRAGRAEFYAEDREQLPNPSYYKDENYIEACFYLSELHPILQMLSSEKPVVLEAELIDGILKEAVLKTRPEPVGENE
jgi:hypothetical protein